jgi:hypothetical protein
MPNMRDPPSRLDVFATENDVPKELRVLVNVILVLVLLAFAVVGGWFVIRALSTRR